MKKASEKIATIEPTEKFPYNKTFDKQLRFLRTKKTASNKNKVLTKPTLEGKECVVQLLGEQEISICGICFMDDNATNAPIADWVSCSNCQIWVHIWLHIKKNLDFHCLKKQMSCTFNRNGGRTCALNIHYLC